MSNIIWNNHRGYAARFGTSASPVTVMPSHADFGTRGNGISADLGAFVADVAVKPATAQGPRSWSPPI